METSVLDGAVRSVEVQLFENTVLTAQVPIPEGLRVVEDAVPPQGYGMFHIMNSKDGDKRVIWNAQSLAEIQSAKRMFDDLKAQGLTPFRVGARGKASANEMEEFDPLAEQVIFAPAKMAVGG